jgi:hypothetical protein
VDASGLQHTDRVSPQSVSIKGWNCFLVMSKGCCQIDAVAQPLHVLVAQSPVLGGSMPLRILPAHLFRPHTTGSNVAVHVNPWGHLVVLALAVTLLASSRGRLLLYFIALHVLLTDDPILRAFVGSHILFLRLWSRCSCPVW